MPAESEPHRLRRSAQQFGHQLTDSQARKLYERVGEHDLAIDALLMHIRPEWLEQIAGVHPFPPSLGELLDPKDVADVDEWGHAA